MIPQICTFPETGVSFTFTVPAAVPSINFLSGGQGQEEATGLAILFANRGEEPMRYLIDRWAEEIRMLKGMIGS